MNFGQNLYNWFLSNAQSLVLMAIAVIGVYLGFKREFSKTYRISGDCLNRCRFSIQCCWCKRRTVTVIQ